MAKSIYGQLNQANIGASITDFLEDIFKDRSPEEKSEANTFLGLAGTASTEEEFTNLSNLLPDFFKKNDTYSPEAQALEAKTSSTFHNRKLEFNRFKEAHNDVINMTNSDYLVSATDKDGGIQNITKEDVIGWNHERLTEELGKANRLVDSFELVKEGYKHPMVHSTHTTKSLMRDIGQYRDVLTSALEIAIYTGEIPDDEAMIRAILSGRTDKVKEISQEEQSAAIERYKAHDNNIDSYDNLLNKMSSYKEPDQQFSLNQFINSVVAGEEGGANQEIVHNLLETYTEEGKMVLDYNDYASKIGIALESEINLRNQANKKHKQYAGKFYEELNEEMGPALTKLFEEGVSEETVVPPPKKEPEPPVSYETEEDLKQTVSQQDNTLMGKYNLNQDEYNEIMKEYSPSYGDKDEWFKKILTPAGDAIDFNVPQELVDKESKYKTIQSDIKKARSNLFSSNISLFKKNKVVSSLKSKAKKGYDIDNNALKDAISEVSKIKDDISKYKKELKQLGSTFKKTTPPQTSVAFEKRVRKLAQEILKNKNLKATSNNWNLAMSEARNLLRLEYGDIWGTKGKRGDTKVPYYMTGSRRPMP